MADVYTPTKTIDGGLFATTSETPAVYVPTPINSDASTSNRTEDQTTRQKYGAADAYSPSNPGIRIVKRKPKAPVAASTPQQNQSAFGKRRATDDAEDPALAALRSAPKKGILRTPDADPNRAKRRIFFADTRQLPLVHIKEIERIAASERFSPTNLENEMPVIPVHSNIADFRGSEKNEAAHFLHGDDQDEVDDVDWGVLKVKKARVVRQGMSESGKREEKRVAESGVMRGATFGTYTLECIPELNEQAAADLANYNPIRIPTESVPSEPTTLSALRNLPLPGRYRQQVPAQKSAPIQKPVQYGQQQQQHVQHPPPHHPQHAQYSHHYAGTPVPTSYGQPVIQQVFQETEPVSNYYTASVPEPVKPVVEPVKSSPESKFELPANLKEMLSQLKKKGFVSSEDTAPTNSAPVNADPLTAAMQTAQQMMNQQNMCTAEETSQDNVMEGYVARFATPDVIAQERNQDSMNSEGWTQSGWKIQEACVYYINRPGGCNRGDQCRFLHDEELRRKTMAELPPRGSFHHRDQDDRGFRGGSRGRAGFRGSFRGQDRDFRDRQGTHGAPPPQQQRNSRFNDQESHGYRGGRFNNRGFGHSQSSRFDQMPATYIPTPLDQGPSTNESQDHDGGSPPKKARISRFDKKQDDPAGAETDHRAAPRRQRFDEMRSHRSRFDQPAADRDDRSINHEEYQP